MITAYRCTVQPETVPFWVLPISQFGKLCMTTLQPHLHSSLSIATCLGRWRLMASRLSPFLPASDPRLPGARQGKVLSLHHLEGKILAYMNTQLSRYNDLAAHPPVYTGFERTGRTHRVHRTSAGIRHTFRVAPQTADSASGGFIRQIPPLPVPPAVETVE